ncbi:glycosyltransferase [Vibrio spartinae]|uniref:D-inositol-3-phosphate glycosyltransferase n=1 Tax=Vibrio spartinae TaxID=1918945 RepID=A0A1N6MA42_9VIBR|nr:glycosyltransferase [Vibrio spartinae]SIO96319.1 D-inositol-3-phosphate glycosyltransferase [Vibrio spartinae]
MKGGYTLISFASSWGYTRGGINAFNTDFLGGIKEFYQDEVQVICVVLKATKEDISNAAKNNIRLVVAPYDIDPEDAVDIVVSKLKQLDVQLNRDRTIILGHDRITGEISILVGQKLNIRSSVIHHMSYEHYESVAENAASAEAKRRIQQHIFEQADVKFAVGPLLRDALSDLLDTDDVHMLVPGLADISPRSHIRKTFSLYVSGRLSIDTSKLKQGQLAVAAFASSVKQAMQHQFPENLTHPKLILRGVDFDPGAEDDFVQSEKSLKQFAADYAGRVININPLPYATERAVVLEELRLASAAAMPSWHEGFGLVAWEAIAAGVPVILSRNSGVYQLLKENHAEFASGFTWPVDIGGQVTAPYFSDHDLHNISKAVIEIARDTLGARKKALKLKSELAHYTWGNCAQIFFHALGWYVEGESVRQTIPDHGNRADSNRPGEGDSMGQQQRSEPNTHVGCQNVIYGDQQIITGNQEVITGGHVTIIHDNKY